MTNATDSQTELPLLTKIAAATICLTITTPLLMILFCMAESSYEMWEYGVLLLVGLLFICSLIACSICLFAGIHASRIWYSILFGLIMAAGPFLGNVIGVKPNMHGFSLLLWAGYVVVAWGVAGCVLIINLWMLVFRKRPIIGIK